MTDQEIVSVAETVLPSSANRSWRNSRDQAMVRELARRVHATVGTHPGEEHKWLDLAQVRRRPGLHAELSRAFRPKRPASWQANPRTWLSSVDIAEVMRQYETSHGLHFVGVFPRDFATRVMGRCVSEPMCNLHVRALQDAGRSSAGIVFNMDKHTQRGSHWAACFVGVNPRRRHRFGVWYYDSVARPPPPEIAAFMQRMQSEAREVFGDKVGARFQRAHNVVRRQYKNTECGIYACLFLVACIATNETFDTICRGIMADDDTTFITRDVLFR